MEFFRSWFAGRRAAGLGAMVVARKRDQSTRKVAKLHLKYVGVSSRTLKRYRTAVSNFFKWRKNSGLRPASEFGEFDFQASEYINELFQKDAPLHWAGDFLSGLKRAHPRCKGQLKTADSYYIRWVKITKRVRALPLSLELAKGLFVYGCLNGQPRFGLTILLGFVLLLRPAEMRGLRCRHFTRMRGDLMTVTLPTTKAGEREGGQPVTVLLRDEGLIRVIMSLRRKSEDFLFLGSELSFRQMYRQALQYYGIDHAKPTPHGVRRGGATWHFGLYGSYDRTTDHGRWAHVKTAKTYIDEAGVAKAMATSTVEGKANLTDAQTIFKKYLMRFFPSPP